MQSGSRYSSDSGSSYSSSSSSGYYAGGGYETPSSSGNDGGDGDDDRNSYSSSEPSEKNEKKSKALPVILISTGVAIMAGIGVTVAVNSKSSSQKPLDAESVAQVSAADRENTISLANQYISNGDYDQAISVLNSYLSENPGDEEARSLLEKAQLAKISGQENQLSDDILANFNSMISSGEYERAANYINQRSKEELASQGLNGSELVNKATTLANGRDLLNKGEYEPAGELLDSYLRTNPRDPEVENLLAQVRRLEALANQGLDIGSSATARNDLSAPDAGRANDGGDLASLTEYPNANSSLGNLSVPDLNLPSLSSSGNDRLASMGSSSGAAGLTGLEESTGRGMNVNPTGGSAASTGNSSSGRETPSSIGSSSAGSRSSGGNAQSSEGSSTGNSSSSTGGRGTNPSVTVLNSDSGRTTSSTGSSSANASTPSTGSSSSGSTSSVGNATPSTGSGRFVGIDTVTENSRNAASGGNPSGGSSSSGNTSTGASSRGGTSTPSTGVSSSATGTGSTGKQSSTGVNPTSSSSGSSSSGNTSTGTSTPSTGRTSTGNASRPATGSNSDIGGKGSLSELLSSAAANNAVSDVKNDGTKTSPDVLLKKYGKRAITRSEALEVGRSFIDDGKYDECINLMNELLTLNSNDYEARKVLDEARDLKRKNGGNRGNRTIDQNLNLARSWIDDGNYDDAITLLNSILKKDPDNTEAKALLEKAMELKNGKDPAKTAAERADKISEALKLINEGKYDEAQAILKDLIAENPNDTQAKNLLDQAKQKQAQRDADNAAKIAGARDALKDSDYQKAIDLLNEVLNNDPNNAEAKKLLDQVKALQKQAEKDRQTTLDRAKKDISSGNPDDAVKALEKYLQEHPDDKEAQKLLDQAKKAAEKERADKADRMDEAREAIKNGNYEKAARILNDILKDDPNNAEAKNLLAQNDAAKAQAERARADKLAEAKRLIENGEYDKAQKILDDLLKDNPNDSEAKKLSNDAKAKKAADEKNASDAITQAKNDIAGGNYDKAIAELNRILKDDPNNAEAKKLLEEAKSKKAAAEKAETDAKIAQAKKDVGNGDYEKAIAALNQILKDDPNNAEAKKLLEEAKAKKADADRNAKVAQAKKDIDSGNYDKAIAELNQILKEDPNNAEAKKLLEEAKSKKAAAEKEAANKSKIAQAKKDIDSGNYDKAIAELNQILKDDPNNAEAKKLLEEAKAKKDAAEKAKDRTDKLSKARSLMNGGNYDEAIDILNELLKEDPNDAQAKNLLSQAQTKKAAAERDRANKLAKARTDIDSGNYDSAINSMNGLLKANPNDAEAKKLLDEATAKKAAAAKDREDKLSQAQKLIDAGDYEGAAKILDGLLGENSKDADARNLLNKANREKEAAAEASKKADLQAVKQQVENEIAQGKAAIAKGNANDALSHFAAARDLLDSTDNPYASEKLGDMARSLYDAAQNASDATTKTALNNAAAQYASEAVAKNSNNAPAHFVLGMRALDAKNYAKAEEELTLATKQDPTNGIYWYQLGRVQAMEKKYGPAATSFQTAIKYEPTLASGYYNLGYVQEKSGNVTAALESYKNAYKVDTKYERAYIAAARLMANAGDYKGAVEAFGNAIKVNPSNAQTYQEQGSAYANMGDYKSAETSFRKALAYMDPSKPDAATYYNLSSVLSEQEKNSEGVNYAAIAYNNKASVSKVLQVNIVYNYGLLSEKTGETNRAISLYNEALSLDPNHLKSKINLGGLYTKNGNTDSAITYLESANSQSPNNFEVNNNLGNAYREKGDYAKAITYYQNALRINATDNTVRENLAKAYASSGQYSNAKMTYEDVISANPENWSAYLECAKIDMSLGNTKDAVEKLEYLQQHNPSYARAEVSTLLYSLK